MMQVYRVACSSRIRVPLLSVPIAMGLPAELGFYYAKNRFTGSMAVIHQSRQARSMKGNDDYASISVSYRFN